jgi:hypothetical protein
MPANREKKSKATSKSKDLFQFDDYDDADVSKTGTTSMGVSANTGEQCV